MSLPRRANGIRTLAADMAARKLAEVSQRQAVSDRVSYALAVLLGAGAFKYAGWNLVGGIAALQLLGAVVAYRRWRKTRETQR